MLKRRNYYSTLLAVAISCYWQEILGGWSAQAVFNILISIIFGSLFFAMARRQGITKESSLLAAAIFMVSVSRQAGSPKVYMGGLALIFVVMSLRSRALKAGIKGLLVSLFIILHFLSLFVNETYLKFLCGLVANACLYLIAACGIDILLAADNEIGKQILKPCKFTFYIFLPLFYTLLIYFYPFKDAFFFVSRITNILGLALIFALYLIYLIDRSTRLHEPIYLRLFTAAIMESLSISMLLSLS